MESNNPNPTTNNKITNMVKIGITTFDLRAVWNCILICVLKINNFLYIFKLF
jgi:hypothetical protein